MSDDDDLLGAVDGLTAEVHDLSGRLSAKELLAERTERLTRRNRVLIVGIGVVALVAVFALIRVNSVLGCLSDWSAASSERQAVLNDQAKVLAQKDGAADRAMRVLVDYRGDPNNSATDQAKIAYGIADDARIRAQVGLDVLREQYPPPQIEDFCSGMKDSTPGPKDPGP